jgi:serine/threonine protein kinase
MMEEPMPAPEPSAQPRSVDNDCVQDLFARALDQPVDAQDQWLQQQGAPQAVVAEVQQLLQDLAAAEQRSISRHLQAEALLSTAAAADQIPARLGDFRILGVLATGGMGRVFLAEQEQPVRRRVAIKVMSGLFASEAMQRRFDLERQTIAKMNHEAIAQIYDAGLTPDGQPYFAMELVEGGMPFTQYCDHHRMSLRDRLVLFHQVCSGVAHAHQKGVVHRDLKPTNVLATQKGSQHVVKIIDFGIAAQMYREPGVERVTAAGTPIGTPEYMAPEQASPRGDVDTRTDVYALGVMLYELASGRLPFASDQLRALGPADLDRLLSEVEPRRLGSTTGDHSRHALNRSTQPRALQRELRGDLETIVAKAMAKDIQRRYPTVLQLADDLQRYLQNQTVLARPDSVGYRLRKFVRRHRMWCGAAVVVALGASVTGRTLWQERLARQAADQWVRANTAFAAGDNTQALLNLDALRDSDYKNRPEALLLQAKALDAQGRPQEAADVTEALLRAAQGTALEARSQFLAGMIGPAAGTEAGDAHHRRALQLVGTNRCDLASHELAFVEAMTAPSLVESRDLLRRAIAIQPGYLDALQSLVPVLLALGEPKEALQVLDIADRIRATPPAQEPWSVMALTLASTADDNPSLKDTRLEKLGTNPSTHKLLQPVLELDSAMVRAWHISLSVLAIAASASVAQPLETTDRRATTDDFVKWANTLGLRVHTLAANLLKSISPIDSGSRGSQIALPTSFRAVYSRFANPPARSSSPRAQVEHIRELIKTVDVSERLIALTNAMKNQANADQLRTAMKVRGFTAAMRGVDLFGHGMVLGEVLMHLIGTRKSQPENIDSLSRLAIEAWVEWNHLIDQPLIEDDLHDLITIAVNLHLDNCWIHVDRALERWRTQHGETNHWRRFRAEALFARGLAAEAREAVHHPSLADDPRAAELRSRWQKQ